MVRIRHYLDSRPQDIVLTKSGKNMSVRRLNKLKLIVGCATAALFVSLLFPIGIAAKSSLDSPGDQGTILIIASYNPDTRSRYPARSGGMGIVRLPGQFSPGYSVFRMLRQHERNSAPGPEPSGYG